MTTPLTSTKPVKLAPGFDSVALVAMSRTPDGAPGNTQGQTCVLEAGTLSCWGSNYFGQLGTQTSYFFPTPQAIAGLNNPDLVAVGGDHICVRDGGTALKVHCWGAGGRGQLGDGSFTHTDCQAGDCNVQPVEVALSGANEVVQLSAGRSHTCALRGDAVLCWGANDAGQVGLGDGVTADASQPSIVSSAAPIQAKAIAAGGYHTCALLLTNTVQCWGRGNAGQLGNNELIDRGTPVDVVGLFNVVEIAAGEGDTCAVRSNGTVWCWGADLVGTLGNGDAGPSALSAFPVQVKNITDAIHVTIGHAHACVTRSSGDVACWGSNDSGELGDGVEQHAPYYPCQSNFDCSLVPVTVQPPP